MALRLALLARQHRVYNHIQIQIQVYMALSTPTCYTSKRLHTSYKPTTIKWEGMQTAHYRYKIRKNEG